MSYTLEYHKKVVKFLDQCDVHIVKDLLVSVEELRKDPFHNMLDIKSLQWEEKWSYRLRIG